MQHPPKPISLDTSTTVFDILVAYLADKSTVTWHATHANAVYSPKRPSSLILGAMQMPLCTCHDK